MADAELAPLGEPHNPTDVQMLEYLYRAVFHRDVFRHDKQYFSKIVLFDLPIEELGPEHPPHPLPDGQKYFRFPMARNIPTSMVFADGYWKKSTQKNVCFIQRIHRVRVRVRGRRVTMRLFNLRREPLRYRLHIYRLLGGDPYTPLMLLKLIRLPLRAHQQDH